MTELGLWGHSLAVFPEAVDLSLHLVTCTTKMFKLV